MQRRWILLALILVLTACGSVGSHPASSTPTPVPAAMPTPYQTGHGSRDEQIMRVAGTLLSVDVAVAPQAGWPAVVAVDAPLTARDDARVFVRVFNPAIQRWEAARTLGSADSGLFSRFRTAAVAITPDGVVHVVWGAARSPRLGVYAAWSRDYGKTWSAPVPIARATYGVLDAIATETGELLVLANGEALQRPLLIRRDTEGLWHAPEALPAPSWYGSSGALALSGAGPESQLLSLTTGGGETSPDNALFVSRRALLGGEWHVQRHTVAGVGLLSRARAASLDEGQALFTFSSVASSAVYGLLVDGHGSISDERITGGGSDVEAFAAPAFDQQEDRVVVLWTCCADTLFTAGPSTHYAAWRDRSAPGWQNAPERALITGARSASDTAVAQLWRSRQVWLVWAEAVHDVRGRIFDLSTIVSMNEAP